MGNINFGWSAGGGRGGGKEILAGVVWGLNREKVKRVDGFEAKYDYFKANDRENLRVRVEVGEEAYNAKAYKNINIFTRWPIIFTKYTMWFDIVSVENPKAWGKNREGLDGVELISNQ